MEVTHEDEDLPPGIRYVLVPPDAASPGALIRASCYVSSTAPQFATGKTALDMSSRGPQEASPTRTLGPGDGSRASGHIWTCEEVAALLA